MRFVQFSEVAERLRGRAVAIVGSAPSCAQSPRGFVDGHDIVVRVNNYKLGVGQGFRTDVHYSFYGSSIRKSAEDLKRDGVTLCLCKCPDAKPLASDWHERTGRQNGIDFRYIYQLRRDWWFCDTYVPDAASFMDKFELLGRHIPTTGFAAILDVLACRPRSVYLTGFDFFSSGLHNVDEAWRQGDPADPIGHRPDLEAAWVAKHAREHLMMLDAKASEILAAERAR